MKKFLLTVLSFILVFMAGILNAAFAENFYIENYDVLINVEKDAVLDIKETIDVNFTTPSHGIIRRIPFRYNQQYPDGRKLHRVARLKNVKVSERFGSHYDNSDYVIKIGDPDVLVSGQHSYEISYKYVNQKDPFEGYDELYHNVIGIGWGVPINNASFKINMPEQFDNSKIGVSIGKHGKPGFSGDADIYANKMSVWGQTLRTLSPHEGITVRIELPDNYFESSGKSDAGLRYMTLTIIAVCVFIAFIVWFIYGKDEPVIPIINFYPPENKNSAEIGAEFKGSAYDKCVVSLIIYLASKGYISIRDDDSSFEFVKLKEYDGTNSIERKMMQILFCDDDTVSESELEESPVFYRECEKLMQELTKKTKKSIFDPKACTPGKVILLIACTVGILVSVLYALTSYSFSSLTALVQSQENLVMSILVILGTIVVIPAVIGKRSASLYAFWALWYTGFSGIPLVMLFTENQQSSPRK